MFPVDVRVTFENGEQCNRTMGRRRSVEAVHLSSGRSRAVSAQVDPDRVLLLDVNYTNNSRTLAPKDAAGRHASGR